MKNVGILTSFTEVGNYYLSKNYIQVLRKSGLFDVFILARPTKRGDTWLQNNYGEWADDFPENKNKIFRITENRWQVTSQELIKFIKKYKIDILIWNEEDRWDLIKLAKKMGVKNIFCVDFMRIDSEWSNAMQLFDLLFCTSKTARDHCEDMRYSKRKYVGWCVDTEKYKPIPEIIPEHFFIHHCGYFGRNMRKGTDFVIRAFDKLSKKNNDVKLLIRSQIDPFQTLNDVNISDDIKQIVTENEQIDFVVDNCEDNSRNYAYGQVYVCPSRNEGLGITLYEAMSCGLPVITTDAGPMKDCIVEGKNGELSKIDKIIPRWDGMVYGESVVNIDYLSNLMLFMYSLEPEKIKEYKENARKYILENCDLNSVSENSFYSKVISAVKEL